ncbi:FAD-dependent oxidoreductase [Actinocrinis puniceicyclus]|uniref:FAD-dependent oxidoreductase n=1 Tax=Actinocrinis puniceicyclus TaxID=977794 RepID=A0A8J7WPK1_9ACTN|nr:FAD-dependent oxidoreductase [Actinocrinis puniceicyclus]MBS2963557.1 FAD-dependent oxidoreductase [Actinocrinis puniceicyclus]
MDRYDLVVLGGGSAGLTGARLAARFGARVLLAERGRLGGDCLWTGCVPSKALLHAAAQVQAAREAGDLGLVSASGPVDLAKAMARVKAAIRQIEPHDSAEALATDAVEVARGEAHFTGPRTLRVGAREVGFRYALIATGGSPALPPIPGLAEARPLTSDTVWDLTELPGRLVVLGGGPIGCELGQAFARLGAKVTIVEAMDRLLPRAEPRAAAVLAERLATEGVEVLIGVKAERVDHDALYTNVGVLSYDRLLVTTGRRANIEGLGLNAAGVRTDERGGLQVDARLRTSNRRIYAAGDVSGSSAFTHLAGVQAATAVSAMLLGVRRRIDEHAVPSVTFTDPEVAQVGVTEQEAHARHGPVRVRDLEHERVDRAVADGRTEGFTRLVLGRRGRIVGATVVAPRAGETIAHLAAAVRHGWSASQYAATIHPYPTYADGPWNAALAEAADRLAAPGTGRVVRFLLGARRRWNR